jgi:hypothetical protein
MTPRGIAALRVGATLAHALPGVRLRLRGPDGRTLLAVAGERPDSTVVAPCVFRAAVARAHRRAADGARLTFLGLPLGHDPALDVGVPPGGRAFTAGLLAVPIGGAGSAVQAFATTVPADDCRRVVALRAHPAATSDVHVVYDDATEVTLVHVAVPVAAASRTANPVLVDVLAAMAVDELIAALPSSARKG